MFDKVVVEKFFTVIALGVKFIAAMVANINVNAVRIDGKRNLVGEEIFVANFTENIIFFEATRADKSSVMNGSHVRFRVKSFTTLAT